MERIMGCNEKVLLAIAETAALAKWRFDIERQGTLSFMELAERAKVIEDILRFVGPAYNGAGFQNSMSSDIDDMLGLNQQAKVERAKQAHTIRLVSNVFRATGKLYLHTVVSKCNPDVKEIKQAVQETVEAFQNLQASDVDRSLVFPIALAGCMTDNTVYRSYLEGRLKALGKQGEAVGNTKSCLQLMYAVWAKRDAEGGPRVVDWIDTMKEMGWSLLLV